MLEPDYNAIFQSSDPMQLFNKYPVTPPATSDQRPTDAGELFDAPTRSRAYTGVHADEETMTRELVVNGNQVVWIKFKTEPPSAHKPGAISFDISNAKKPDYVPIHFLPWKSQRVVHMKIPVFNITTPNVFTDETNPNRFFTAALSGCSVFARGDARSPEVYHGGVDGLHLVSPEEFWRDCIRSIERRSPAPQPQALRLRAAPPPGQLQGEVNRAHYSSDPNTPGTTPQAQAFMDWYTNDNNQKAFKVTDIKPWGCVFGIRNEHGEWEFSLQENATVSYKSFLKKQDTREYRIAQPVPGTSNKRLTDVDGRPVSTNEEQGKYFGKSTVYWTERSFAKPMNVRRFFPDSGPISIRRKFSVS